MLQDDTGTQSTTAPGCAKAASESFLAGKPTLKDQSILWSVQYHAFLQPGNLYLYHGSALDVPGTIWGCSAGCCQGEKSSGSPFEKEGHQTMQLWGSWDLEAEASLLLERGTTCRCTTHAPQNRCWGGDHGSLTPRVCSARVRSVHRSFIADPSFYLCKVRDLNKKCPSKSLVPSYGNAFFKFPQGTCSPSQQEDHIVIWPKHMYQPQKHMAKALGIRE